MYSPNIYIYWRINNYMFHKYIHNLCTFAYIIHIHIIHIHSQYIHMLMYIQLHVAQIYPQSMYICIYYTYIHYTQTLPIYTYTDMQILTNIADISIISYATRLHMWQDSFTSRFKCPKDGFPCPCPREFFLFPILFPLNTQNFTPRDPWTWYWREETEVMAYASQLWYCGSLQYTATHYNLILRLSPTLQYTATHCNTLQHTAAHCNTLQHTATHCNTLQHTAAQLDTAAQPQAGQHIGLKKSAIFQLKSLVLPQKNPFFPQKSPKFPWKSPIFSHIKETPAHRPCPMFTFRRIRHHPCLFPPAPSPCIPYIEIVRVQGKKIGILNNPLGRGQGKPIFDTDALFL